MTAGKCGDDRDIGQVKVAPFTGDPVRRFAGPLQTAQGGIRIAAIELQQGVTRIRVPAMFMSLAIGILALFEFTPGQVEIPQHPVGIALGPGSAAPQRFGAFVEFPEG